MLVSCRKVRFQPKEYLRRPKGKREGYELSRLKALFNFMHKYNIDHA